MTRPPLILYHGNCLDGFTSAWVAAQRFPGAELVPCTHGRGVGIPVDGRDIWMLDFCFPAPEMAQIARDAERLRVLDHHISAAETLADFPGATLDMNRSGAGLAWDTFFPEAPRPWIVDYVEDQDLWRFDLPDSRAVGASLGMWPLDLDAWTLNTALGRAHWANIGAVVMAFRANTVARMLCGMRRRVIAGIEVPTLNSPVFQSELGHILAEDAPFAAIWSDRADGRRAFGLRSAQSGADVCKIAQCFGGGGHIHAAGFSVPEHTDWAALIDPSAPDNRP